MHNFVSIVSTPFTFSLGSCTSNLSRYPPISYPSCHLWSFRKFIWIWWISQWLVTWLLCFQVSILHHVMCSREVKPMSPIPHIPDQLCRPSLCHWISQLYQIISAYWSHFHVSWCGMHQYPPSDRSIPINAKSSSINGSRNPNEYLGSCNH